METEFDFYRFVCVAVFIDYLWGMETWEVENMKEIIGEFIDYLWGMETIYVIVPYPSRFEVYRLPMRDGNTHRGIEIVTHPAVYRLPMRDGN